MLGISPVREVSTRNGKARVAEATIEAENGKFILTLWGQQIEQVKPGNTIEIENGYVTVFMNVPRVNVGQYGKLTVHA